MEMKAYVVFICAAAFVVGACAEEADTKKSSDPSTHIFKRLIPADVLRDFPGMCFASTRCATVAPGMSWDLTPFCGRSTCIKEKNNTLMELVEDCGPLPLVNDKCKFDAEKTNKTAPFPYCCPKFTCEPGVTLTYQDAPPEEAKKE